MIDSHVHLDSEQYPDPSGSIKRALYEGVTAIVVPGTGPASNRKVMDLARKFPDIVYPALGFHPERFDQTDLDADDVLEMIAHERASICAIGEVGLPWYGERSADANLDAQAKTRLARFARIASETDLALILHAPHRRAAEALEIIRAAKVRRAVFHWHKADEQTTRAIIDSGYFISLTPEVSYRERDQELARMLPANRMLVETDGPWPYGGQFAGRLTEPAFIKETIAAIAHLRCTTIDEIATATTANARALFGINS
jgi:TatD DNase family protein